MNGPEGEKSDKRKEIDPLEVASYGKPWWLRAYSRSAGHSTGMKKEGKDYREYRYIHQSTTKLISWRKKRKIENRERTRKRTPPTTTRTTAKEVEDNCCYNPWQNPLRTFFSSSLSAVNDYPPRRTEMKRKKEQKRTKENNNRKQMTASVQENKSQNTQEVTNERFFFIDKTKLCLVDIRE